MTCVVKFCLPGTDLTNVCFFISGNCAYLNEYGGNIDARLCSSSAELACPKTLYRSEETIKCKKIFRFFFFYLKFVFQIAMEVQNVDLDILVTNTVSYKIIINQFQFIFFNNEE